MRKVLSLFVLMLVISVVGCGVGHTESSAKTTTQNNDAQSSSDISENKRQVIHQGQGKLTSDNSIGTVTVYTEEQTNKDIDVSVYLEAKVNGKSLLYDLGNYDKHVLKYGGGLFLTDLTGDEIDEIVLFMEISARGVALAQIYQVVSDDLVLFCDLNDIMPDITTSYCDNYVAILEDSSVGFHQELDVSKEFIPEQFNENGCLIKGIDVFLHPIHQGWVEKADSPRVICMRYVYLTNCLGKIQTTIEYDSNTNTMAITGINLVAK